MTSQPRVFVKRITGECRVLALGVSFSQFVNRIEKAFGGQKIHLLTLNGSEINEESFELVRDNDQLDVVFLPVARVERGPDDDMQWTAEETNAFQRWLAETNETSCVSWMQWARRNKPVLFARVTNRSIDSFACCLRKYSDADRTELSSEPDEDSKTQSFNPRWSNEEKTAFQQWLRETRDPSYVSWKLWVHDKHPCLYQQAMKRSMRSFQIRLRKQTEASKI